MQILVRLPLSPHDLSPIVYLSFSPASPSFPSHLLLYRPTSLPKKTFPRAASRWPLRREDPRASALTRRGGRSRRLTSSPPPGARAQFTASPSRIRSIVNRFPCTRLQSSSCHLPSLTTLHLRAVPRGPSWAPGIPRGPAITAPGIKNSVPNASLTPLPIPGGHAYGPLAAVTAPFPGASSRRLYHVVTSQLSYIPGPARRRCAYPAHCRLRRKRNPSILADGISRRPRSPAAADPGQHRVPTSPAKPAGANPARCRPPPVPEQDPAWRFASHISAGANQVTPRGVNDGHGGPRDQVGAAWPRLDGQEGAFLPAVDVLERRQAAAVRRPVRFAMVVNTSIRSSWVTSMR